MLFDFLLAMNTKQLTEVIRPLGRVFFLCKAGVASLLIALLGTKSIYTITDQLFYAITLLIFLTCLFIVPFWREDLVAT